MQKNYPLTNLTTLGVPSVAECFCVVRSVEELKKALIFAMKNDLEYRVIGEGSNIFLESEFIRGLVIKNEIRGKEVVDSLVRSNAGENWDDFVAWTISQKRYGLENLSWIPGTVGASPVQNIGAYGVEVAAFIHSVEVCKVSRSEQSVECKTLSRIDCCFGYRDSIFKKPEGKDYIITSVTFDLSAEPNINISYPDVKVWLERNSKKASDVTPELVREAIISIRKAKLPDLTQVGTAGSFFKNPVIKPDHFAKIKSKYDGIPGFPINSKEGPMIKVPLAWILDSVCKVKGLQIGCAYVHEKQPLVLINKKGGSYNDIQSLVRELSRRVFEATNINIEQEVVSWR